MLQVVGTTRILALVMDVSWQSVSCSAVQRSCASPIVCMKARPGRAQLKTEQRIGHSAQGAAARPYLGAADKVHTTPLLQFGNKGLRSSYSITAGTLS